MDEPNNTRKSDESFNTNRLLFCLKKLCSRKLLVAIGLGQLLSLLVCLTAVTSGFLQEEHVYIPTGQSFLNYVLLSVVFIPLFLKRTAKEEVLSALRLRYWCYLLLAFADVEANYLMVLAYQYTTVTSVQLLDCCVIPTVLLLSRCLLKVRYRVLHYVAVCTCLLGAGAMVLADVWMSRFTADAVNRLWGDLFCIGGAVLYGVSNVGQEYLVRKNGGIEFVALLAASATIISGIQCTILERNELLAVNFSSFKTSCSLTGFVLALFCIYVLMPYAMRVTSATAVNLNLLSSDFYALFAGLFLFHYQFHVLYFFSFAVIITGVLIYHTQPVVGVLMFNPQSGTPSQTEQHATLSCCTGSDESSLGSSELTYSTSTQQSNDCILISQKWCDEDLLSHQEASHRAVAEAEESGANASV